MESKFQVRGVVESGDKDHGAGGGSSVYGVHGGLLFFKKTLVGGMVLPLMRAGLRLGVESKSADT